MPNSSREIDQIGPIVLSLLGPLKQGISVNEGVVTGVVNVEEFEGPLQGRAFDSLLQEIIQANVYVNVYTKSNKKGEIRGRIRKVKSRKRLFILNSLFYKVRILAIIDGKSIY